MNIKVKTLFLLSLIFVLGACSNLSNSFSTSPSYTEDERSHFNVEEESQFYAVGTATISESGNAVAQMKAKEQAKTALRKLITDESTLVLDSFFGEINSKNISTSSSTKKDLASLVATKLVSEAKQTNTWSDNGNEYIVLAIDKEVVPEESKTVFIDHIQRIITDLQNIVNQASSEFKTISTKQIEDDKTDDSKKVEESTTTPVKKTSPTTTKDKNSEPDVFLDDF